MIGETVSREVRDVDVPIPKGLTIVLAAGMMCLPSASALGQSPPIATSWPDASGAPTQSSGPGIPAGLLTTSLLTLEDLPAGFASTGIRNDSNDYSYDAAALVANDGLGPVSQVWTSPDEGYVADLRFTFPDAQAAAAYVATATPILSQAEAQGMTLASDVLAGADESSHWMRRDTYPADDWVFRFGPIVGLVLVWGVGSDVPATIAEHAVARAAAAVGGAGTSTPPASPDASSP